MFIELVMETMLGGGAAIGILMAKRRWFSEKPTEKPISEPFDGELDVVPWLYKSTHGGHVCPKCSCVSAGDKCRSDYCKCSLYAKGYYHFKCPNCKFKAIMKPVDTS